MRPKIFAGCLAVALAGIATGDDKTASTATKSPASKAKTKADIVPGYELRMIEGFTVLINRKGSRRSTSRRAITKLTPWKCLKMSYGP